MQHRIYPRGHGTDWPPAADVGAVCLRVADRGGAGEFDVVTLKTCPVALRLPGKLVRVILPQHIPPFIKSCTPRDGSVSINQRQSPVVAVVQMDFPHRGILRLHLIFHLFRRQAALRQPLLALGTHLTCVQLLLEVIQQRHQFRHEYHSRILLEFLRQRAMEGSGQHSCCCFNAD